MPEEIIWHRKFNNFLSEVNRASRRRPKAASRERGLRSDFTRNDKKNFNPKKTMGGRNQDAAYSEASPCQTNKV